MDTELLLHLALIVSGCANVVLGALVYHLDKVNKLQDEVISLSDFTPLSSKENSQ